MADGPVKRMKRMLTFRESAQAQDAEKKTKEHQRAVKANVDAFIEDLRKRGKTHDASKLESPEVEGFAKATHQLKSLTYDSEEYKVKIKEMEPFLKHHYENNSHHPEHHEKGVDGMTLVDVVEMFCDWQAAAERHDDGNINDSIDKNEKRFKMSKQLAQIFRNTI